MSLELINQRFSMEREELLGLVNGELGSTQLTLSERTINEELDDVLGDFGEDEATNAALVTRIANRLKRMDGNLHADVSKQVNDYKKKNTDKPKPQSKPNKDDNDEIPAWFKSFSEKFEAAEAERKAEKTKQEKDALVKSVKEGLKAKFKEANMEVNEFFVNTAMSKLEIPTENPNAKNLIGELEKLYNADLKAAGVEQHAKPTFGNQGNGDTDKSVSDFFARKAKKEGWSKDQKK